MGRHNAEFQKPAHLGASLAKEEEDYKYIYRKNRQVSIYVH